MTQYTSLQEKLEQTTAIKWFPGHIVENSWIAAAEQELGYCLPPSYCWWLKNYGNGGLSGSHIFTLAAPEFQEIADDDLLYNYRLDIHNEHWQQNFPQSLRLFVPDSDELYFFDVSSRDEQDELKVMCFDLANGDVFEYASNFAQFLEQLIDERT